MVKLVEESKYIIQTRQTAHIPIKIVAKKIGTSAAWQTLTTNCPATLQTATANLILLQQQMSINKRKPEIPKEMYP